MPTFYYTLKAKRNKKDDSLRRKIKELYDSEGKGNEKYGYRRICDKLRQTEEYSGINHKKVARLMKKMGLKGYISKSGSRKYNSYKGSIGKVADNVVRRYFNPERPNQIWSTDITEFKLPSCNDMKVYLSPIKDFYDGAIIRELLQSPTQAWSNPSSLVKLSSLLLSMVV